MGIRRKDLNERIVVYVCVPGRILVSKVSIATFRTIFDKSVNSHVLVYSYQYIHDIVLISIRRTFNPFVPNAPFRYPLKTSENRQV